MQAQTPKTLDELADLVQQAIYEIDELRMCMEDADAEEDGDRYQQFLDPLDAMLRRLYADMIEGNYQSGDADLPYMDILRKWGREIPFRNLLEVINRAHRSGV